MTIPTSEHDVDAPPYRGFVAPLVALLVLLAGAYVVWAGTSTASGRIAASTSNESSFIAAGAIDLTVDAGEGAASTGLLIDAAGLYPGLRVERCFAVSYAGTLQGVPVRLFGQPGGGTGLEAFIDTEIERGSGTDNECGDFSATATLFEGTLLALWEQHGSFDRGVPVIEAADDGATTWVRIAIEVVDDNDAQALTTAFWLTLEARP